MSLPRRWMYRCKRKSSTSCRTLQDQFDLTYLFISHDLGVVRYMCDEVALLYLGKIVEVAATEVIFEKPQTSLYPSADLRHSRAGPGYAARGNHHSR